MENRANLILRLKRSDDPQWQLRGVARFRLDGHGGMILWDAETGKSETIEVARLEAVVIEPVPARQAS
jgi:hypothetical protein